MERNVCHNKKFYSDRKSAYVCMGAFVFAQNSLHVLGYTRSTHYILESDYMHSGSDFFMGRFRKFCCNKAIHGIITKVVSFRSVCDFNTRRFGRFIHFTQFAPG